MVGLVKWVAYLTLVISYLSDTSNVSLHKQFSVKQRIFDIHIQEQNMRLRNSKKLNTLMKFYMSNLGVGGGNYLYMT